MNLLDIKGIGPSVLKKLEKLGISDVQTLLYHFPSKYVDRRKQLKVFDLKLVENESYHCIATIKNLKRLRLRGRMEMTTGTLEDDTGSITVTWFNNPYVVSQYKNGDEVIFSGIISKGKVSNPKMKKIGDYFAIESFARIEATYPETRGLKSYQISQFVERVFLEFRKEKYELKETLPKKVLKNERFVSLTKALEKIHFPLDENDLAAARERLGFDEIYKILKKVNRRKQSIKKYNSHKIKINPSSHEVLVNNLAFNLTDSQNQSILEIFSDLEKQHPMHRLLNGDVGSGKTIVAASAIWQVTNNGLQSIVLAPTGVLANQHYELFRKLFENFGIPLHLITSDTRKLVNNLKKTGEDLTNAIFIGTHALLHHFDLFKNIGLVVIDEQHKFGVKQRELLENVKIGDFKYPVDHSQTHTFPNSQANHVPHVLSMSATPIPRSLALTLFGDIEVSILEKPTERKKIITKNIFSDDLVARMYEWIRKEVLENKEQVYVVCPLIEESEKVDAKAAVQEFENLKQIFPELKIELLHGKIKQKEKDEILSRFKSGEFDILVSTSVIEVGIDNPNANIMIIEGAERFGLAQLHQIRGRVGRSNKQSYCFLKSTNEIPSERLEYFAMTNDGFKVAEYDLKSRGPGEVYGEAQSGIPDLKIANILDLELIRRVKKYFK